MAAVLVIGMAAAKTCSAATLRGIRVGQHPRFTRIVLDFEGLLPGYRLHRSASGKTLWIVLSAGLKTDIQLPPKLPRELRGLELSQQRERGESRLGIGIRSNLKVRAFPVSPEASGTRRLVVDLLKPAAGESRPTTGESTSVSGYPWRALGELSLLPRIRSARAGGTASRSGPRGPATPPSPPPPLPPPQTGAIPASLPQALSPSLSPAAEPEPMVPALRPFRAAPVAALTKENGPRTGEGGERGGDVSLKKRLYAFPKRVLKDAVQAVKAPARWDRSDWLVMGAIAAGTAATFAADEEVQDLVLGNPNDTATDAFKAINAFGRTEVQLGVIGTFLAAGKLTRNPRLVDTGVMGLEALLFTAVTVLPLKAVVGRDRPRETSDAFEFSPFSLSNASFPSGDTATAFALGTVVADQYRQPWVTGTAYGLATLVGAARIYRNKHWLSDTVGGAAIGYLIGRFVAKMQRQRRARKSGTPQPARFRVYPVISPGAQVLAASMEFQ
ncbi:MAG: phosphatase PAP2 family protein [Nitrospinota bacterium]